MPDQVRHDGNGTFCDAINIEIENPCTTPRQTHLGITLERNGLDSGWIAGNYHRSSRMGHMCLPSPLCYGLGFGKCAGPVFHTRANAFGNNVGAKWLRFGTDSRTLPQIVADGANVFALPAVLWARIWQMSWPCVPHQFRLTLKSGCVCYLHSDRWDLFAICHLLSVICPFSIGLSSTRRFSALPSSVSFVAIGLLKLNPFTVSRSLSIPLRNK